MAFFYHSNIAPLSIVGLTRVVAVLADPTQFGFNRQLHQTWMNQSAIARFLRVKRRQHTAQV